MRPLSAASCSAAVAALDLAYQAAVKANDAETMGSILHPDFVLVTGSGAVATREDLLREARAASIAWEIQDEEPGSHTVRVFGDTAVVTAKLHLKYRAAGQPHGRTLSFSEHQCAHAPGLAPCLRTGLPGAAGPIVARYNLT